VACHGNPWKQTKTNNGEKWAQCVCVGISRMVSSIKKRLLSHNRAPFEYHRKVTFNETCLLLQNVFTSLQDKAEHFLEYLSLSAAKNIE
jgi:hypothetical protein